MKPRTLFTILLCLLFLPSFSQLLKKKSDFSLQFGSSFLTTSGYGSSLVTFISPGISYPVSSRFKVNAGITFVNTTLFDVKPYSSLFTEQTWNANFTDAILYVNGQYMLNNRITLSGSAFTTINLWQKSPGYNPGLNFDSKGLIIDVNYKLSDNIFIEAKFGYIKGRLNPYFGNPFYDAIMNGPFIPK